MFHCKLLRHLQRVPQRLQNSVVFRTESNHFPRTLRHDVTHVISLGLLFEPILLGKMLIWIFQGRDVLLHLVDLYVFIFLLSWHFRQIKFLWLLWWLTLKVSLFLLTATTTVDVHTQVTIYIEFGLAASISELAFRLEFALGFLVLFPLVLRRR